MSYEERDAYGLFNWYSSRFYRAEHRQDRPVDARRVLGLLTEFQWDYNQAVSKPCKGMQYMQLPDRPNSYCGSPLCPTCWHVRQVRLLQHLHRLSSNGLYCIYQTAEAQLDQDLPEELTKQLLSYWSRYKTVGYSLNFWAHDRQCLDKQTPFGGRLVYFLSAIYAADKPVRKPYSDGQGVVLVKQDLRDPASPFIGEIEVVAQVDEKIDLLDAWYDHLVHPWEFRSHPVFTSQYLAQAGRKWPPGKSWCRTRKIPSTMLLADGAKSD